MAGVEKTWAGRVRLGMKVVMIGLIVEDDVVVETSLIFTQALPLMSHVVVPYMSYPVLSVFLFCRQEEQSIWEAAVAPLFSFFSFISSPPGRPQL